MTDETREQIEKHAIHYANHQTHGNGNYFAIVKHFESGATHQHPISYEAGRKAGRIEAIDNALKEVSRYKDLFEYGEDYRELVKELEALKTEKP